MQLHPHHQDSLDAQYETLRQGALDAYRAKQEAFARVVAQFSQWSIDDQSQSLHFIRTDAQTQVFQIIPIGTYLPMEEEWAWAWANDAFPDACRNGASRIKDICAKTGYKIFETSHFRTNTNDVDELCALSLQELGGVAVFKVKHQTPWVYYVVK